MQTPSPAQVPQSSAPPLQPLPILPQYWPPAGAHVTDGVQAASLSPASTVITGVPAPPPVPVAGPVPAVPVEPPAPGPAPALPPVIPVPEPGVTLAVQPSEMTKAVAIAQGPGKRTRTTIGLPAAPKTALAPRPCENVCAPVSAGRASRSPSRPPPPRRPARRPPGDARRSGRCGPAASSRARRRADRP